MNSETETPSTITFGETMVRYSTKGYERIEQADEFNGNIGGAESNFAVAFSRLGGESAWVSKLTRNSLGNFIRNKVREQGVDTSNVIWTEDFRNGKYYIEFGRKPRITNVIYDRSGSAVSNIELEEINWEVLSGYDLFFTTGITPALSSNCEQAAAKFIENSHRYKVTVMFDLNYRGKLWSYSQARNTLVPILENVDILIASLEDVQNILHLSGNPKDVLKELQSSCELDVAVLTLGSEGAAAIEDDRVSSVEPYEVEEVDRVGAGDAFDAGFAYTYLNTGDLKKALEWGMAMAAFDHTIPGDIIITDVEDIQAVLEGQISDIER